MMEENFFQEEETKENSSETISIDSALSIDEVHEIFDDRVLEVEKYFKFLEEILSENTYLCFEMKRTHKRKKLDIDTQRILKANGFLILYNLVESTIKKSIGAIYKAMLVDGLSYKDIREELKDIWIKNNYTNYKDANDNNFKAFIKTILKDVLDEVTLKLDSDKIPISGNVDAKKIRLLGQSYGFSCSTRKKNHGGRLHIVKIERNSLAHGDISFAECGGNHTVEDLVSIKKEVITYVRAILNNIKKYIDKGEYASTEYRARN